MDKNTMYTILSRNGYLIELEVTCMIRKIIEKLFWHYQEKENWKMKMNEPIAIKKLTNVIHFESRQWKYSKCKGAG